MNWKARKLAKKAAKEKQTTVQCPKCGNWYSSDGPARNKHGRRCKEPESGNPRK
jgi:hypothetical protein